MNGLSNYSRSFFETLSGGDLTLHLDKLEKIIRARFSLTYDFIATKEEILTELREIGHQLHSLDYDSDIRRFREVWGSNYRDSNADGLEIEFESPDKISVVWISCGKPNR